MTIIGVGLLLDQLSVFQLMDFKKKWSHVLDGELFGSDTNVLHVTLYQFPVEDPSAIQLPKDVPLGTLEWGELMLKSPDWAFATTSIDSFLVDAQRLVIDALLPFVDRSQINDGVNLAGYSQLEREEYLTTGYRYSGAAFDPHVTLGQTTPEEMSEEIVDDFRRMFSGRAVGCVKAVLYRAGDRGALVEIFNRHRLATRSTTGTLT